ncbi:MAG: MATE family efflux transporter [Prevotellaceae bacterium]|jgi:putative MATE family efflux protein|nr:MATE family efflux transporter [Prevotellaceae bacterium]
MDTQGGVRNLTEGKIFGQLTRLAAPIMATGFVQMAYTLVDMAWIGHLGSREMAAVGTMGIILWLVSSVAFLTKAGAEITIAQSVGSQRLDRAAVYASHTVSISLIMGLFVSIALILFADPVIDLFKLEVEVAEIAHEYLQIVCIALPSVFLVFTFSGIYNGIGRSSVPFYFLTVGLVCNMLLDPVMIFGINGAGAMGTKGAAIATAFSQILVMILFIVKMRGKNGILKRFPFFVRLKKSYTLTILKLGFPIAAMNCLFAGINFYMARIASIYGGHLGVMSQTTGSQIEGITWNTSQGFSTALATFVAQNYAAGKISRTFKAYRYTLMLLFSLGVAVTLSFLFFGKEIFSLFIPETDAVEAGGSYLNIIAYCQLFMMLEITTMGIWNGYGKTLPPATVSIIFNLARIPLALALAPEMGINGVWMAITISAVIKGIVSPVWFHFKIRKNSPENISYRNHY